MEVKVTDINEGGLSRIWQHTQDDDTFAIIGSQDKDTGEFHDQKLKNWARRKAVENKQGFRKTIGYYTYQDGTVVDEPGVIIYNIPLNDVEKFVFSLPKDGGINQESIVWKDKDFFGILYADGHRENFTSDIKNMSFKDVEDFGTHLANQMNHNKGTPFKFKFEELTHPGDVSWKNSKNREVIHTTLFEMDTQDTIENTNDDKTKELLDKVDAFIDDVYLLRKSSIMTDGEYAKGNMVFKELRNNGYLDKLKELKVKLTEKELVVEKVEE